MAIETILTPLLLVGIYWMGLGGKFLCWTYLIAHYGILGLSHMASPSLRRELEHLLVVREASTTFKIKAGIVFGIIFGTWIRLIGGVFLKT